MVNSISDRCKLTTKKVLKLVTITSLSFEQINFNYVTINISGLVI